MKNPWKVTVKLKTGETLPGDFVEFNKTFFTVIEDNKKFASKTHVLREDMVWVRYWRKK